MTEKTISELIKEGPGQTIELRRSLPANEIDIKSLARSIVSFANTNDGAVIIGVDEGTKEIIGVDVELNFSEELVKIGRDYCNPSLIPEVRVEKIGSKKIVIVSVKRSFKGPYHADGTCYIRKGKDVYAATYKETESIYSEKKYKDPEGDAWPVKGAAYQDLDSLKVDEYIKKRKDRLGEELDIPKEKFLEQMGILVKDNNQLVPSAGGMLVLGRCPQRFLWSSSVRIVRFKGNDVGDVIIDQKELRGTIQEIIDDARQFIIRHMSLGGRIEGLKRADIPQYPEIAVREAVTNAIVHRDYTILGAMVRIFMFDERIEIYTPGGLPGPVTIENIEFTQYSRNKVIVELLLQLEYMEKLGIGVRRIKLASKESGLPEPKLIDTGVDFVLTLFGSRDRVVQLEKHERVKHVQQMLSTPKKPVEVEMSDKPPVPPPHDTEDKRRKSKIKMIVVGIPLILLIGTIGYYYKRKDSAIKEYRMASNLHAEKQYEKALAYYKNFIKRFPNSEKIVDAQYYVASCLEMLGKEKEAIDAYRYLLQNYPASEKAGYAQYWVGKLYLKQGVLNKAIEEFQKGVRDYSSSPIVLNIFRDLGLAYQKQDNFQKAIDMYQEALNFQDGISNGYEPFQMALCYLSLGQLEKAKGIFEEMILNPASDMEWIRNAKKEVDGLKKMQEEQERVRLKEELIKGITPAEKPPIKEIKEEKSRQEEEVIAKEKEVVKVETPQKKIDIYLARARTYFNQGKFNEAIEQWQGVLSIDVFNKEAKEGIDRAMRKLSPQASDDTYVIYGLVMDVDETKNLVTVNLGKADGMKDGLILGIFKQDDSEQEIGKIEIIETQETFSKAKIISKKVEIVKGNKIKCPLALIFQNELEGKGTK